MTPNKCIVVLASLTLLSGVLTRNKALSQTVQVLDKKTDGISAATNEGGRLLMLRKYAEAASQ